MKKTLTLFAAAIICMSLGAKTPVKKQMVTETFTTDIHCDNCKKKIESNVAVLGKGVKDVQVNVETKEVTVTYDASKNSAENLVKGFQKINVKAAKKQGGCCGKCAQPAAEKKCGEAKQGCCQAKAEAKAAPQGGCCKAKTEAKPAEKGGCCQKK